MEIKKILPRVPGWAMLTLAILASFLVGGQAATVVYNGSLAVPTGGSITNSNFPSGNEVFTTTGGLFTSAPVPAATINPSSTTTATFYFAGDSITYGLGINNQTALGCSGYTYPSPCFADQVSSYFGATESNKGVPSTCLESTTTVGSLCNPAVATPLITSYTTSLLPHAGANNNWFWIMIGTNDTACASYLCNSEAAVDTQVNVATYKADLATIVSALESAGTPGNQIVLSEIIQNIYISQTLANTLAPTALVQNFNTAIAEVALQYHTRLATSYHATGQCIPNVSTQVNPCLFDNVHPNNTGHANIALEYEAATQSNALTARAAYASNATLNSVQAVTNPYNAQFSVKTLNVTGTTSSLYGPLSTYRLLNWGTAASTAGGFMNIGTGASTAAGVAGTCLILFPGASPPPGGVDMTVNCLSGDIGSGGTVKYAVPVATTCTSAAVLACIFSWTCTMSSGACTTTQAIPSGATCTVQANVTPRISSTNIVTDWVTVSGTVLTVHVTDMLASASSAFSGVGSCV